MNTVLNTTKPHHRYFEEICAIPHESFHEQALSQYVANFAKERGLWYYTDALHNVVIKKPATAGYESSPPVMLQAHLDMVCEKTPESSFCFDTDPLRLRMQNGCVMATDTTLGADDGYGVAYMLAVLDAEDIPHPPLECFFSVQEEAGVGGPRGMDYSQLSARRYINLDGCQEGSTNVSTAYVIGGDFRRPIVWEPNRQPCFSLYISGLSAGHASLNAVKDQANAIHLAARTLYAISQESKLHLVSITGGTIRNGIAEECKAVFSCDAAYARQAQKIAEAVFSGARREHDLSDPGMKLHFAKAEHAAQAMDNLTTQEIIALIYLLPTGNHMVNRRAVNPVMSLASRNLGNIRCEGQALVIGYMFRCNLQSQLQDLFDQTTLLASRFGAYYDQEYRYAGYNADIEHSEMIRLWREVYHDLAGKDLYLKYTHGGSDIGTIHEGMGGIDAIVVSPDIKDVHRPTEAMDLASYDRTFSYLREILRRLK